MSRLSAMLRPAGWVYGRCALWRRRRLKQAARHLPCPVISVGNITCGGTGKTPTVEMVVGDLLARDLRPAILSRGYGHRFSLQSGTTGSEMSPLGNDEYHLLRANLPDVPHYQGKDRYETGRTAVDAGAQVIVLDDGFQHVRLHRDLNLVLIDALSPFGNGEILPAGLLREPLEALADADLFGLTRTDLAEPIDVAALSEYLRRRFGAIPQMRPATRPVAWESLAGERSPPGVLAGKSVLAFCGIGHPGAFRRQLSALGAQVADMVCFRDHHRYTESDVESIRRRALELNTDEVVLTQKDAVKLPLRGPTSGWKLLRIEHEIHEGEEAYQVAIERVVSSLPGR